MLSDGNQRSVLYYYVDAEPTLYLRDAYSDTLLCRCGGAAYYTRRVSADHTRVTRSQRRMKIFHLRDSGRLLVSRFNRILFSLFLGLSDYRNLSHHRYVFTCAYWNLPSTICRRSGNRILRASSVTCAVKMSRKHLARFKVRTYFPPFITVTRQIRQIWFCNDRYDSTSE